MVQEHNDAIAAVQECLSILSQLSNGEASLAQVKKGKNSMQKVVEVMKNFKHFRTDHAILTSLVNLASSFANQDAVAKVTAMFEEINNNLTASLV